MPALLWQLPLFVVMLLVTVWILGVGLLSAFRRNARFLLGNIILGIILAAITVILPVLFGWIGA